MSPETPYITSGILLLIAGVAKNGSFPKETIRAAIGVSALSLVASATAETPIAPLVRAIGLLFLLTAGMASVLAISEASAKRKKVRK